jgi:hypothetical protein
LKTNTASTNRFVDLTDPFAAGTAFLERFGPAVEAGDGQPPRFSSSSAQRA